MRATPPSLLSTTQTQSTDGRTHHPLNLLQHRVLLLPLHLRLGPVLGLLVPFQRVLPIGPGVVLALKLLPSFQLLLRELLVVAQVAQVAL